jgi:DNA polymerase III subunit epsilon
MAQFDWLASSFDATVFTVFDTETTGLDPKLCRVVEAGGLRFDSRGIIARFNSLINPKSPMPAEASRINGITDAMLADQPDPGQVIPDFIRFVGDSVLIAHNAPFDISFINEELSRLGLPPLKNRVIDTRIFAREMFPGLPKYALQDLAQRFGIEALDAHRAEDDARVCMELFLVCLAELRKKKPEAIATPSANQAAHPAQPRLAEASATKPIEGAAEADQEDLFMDEFGVDDEMEDEEQP